MHLYRMMDEKALEALTRPMIFKIFFKRESLLLERYSQRKEESNSYFALAKPCYTISSNCISDHSDYAS